MSSPISLRGTLSAATMAAILMTAQAWAQTPTAIIQARPLVASPDLQEDLMAALSHAVEIKTLLERCGADALLVQRADRLVRDYAVRLSQQDRSSAMEQGTQEASSVLQGSAKQFFCAEVRQLGNQWVSDAEALRQTF